jgi:regulatory protein
MKKEKNQIASYALKLLAQKEYSETQIRQKLKLKFSDRYELIEEVIDEFKKLNYISEERYAEMIIRHCLLKKYGIKRIMCECFKKNIKESLVNEYIEKENIDWEMMAFDVLKIRYTKESLIDQNERKKAVLYLMRRGYSMDESIKSIKKMVYGNI